MRGITAGAAGQTPGFGQSILDRIIDEKWLTANGIVGLFPANRVGDDIEVTYRRRERQQRG